MAYDLRVRREGHHRFFRVYGAGRAGEVEAFDFGILHHVPDWRGALREVRRVLKPGGRFYAEEALAPLIDHAVVKKLFEHPRADRFDAAAFQAGMSEAGLIPQQTRRLAGVFAWFTATRSA